VTTNGFDGIDIDYESLHAVDRAAFSQFLRQLGSALHQQHKLLSVDVHPKTAEPGDWDGPQAQDWAVIGQVADEVRLLTYDYSYDGSAPGPIAPPAWMASVVQFAVSVMPPQKVILGIPLYGYDWVGTRATEVAWQDTQALRTRAGATPSYDTATQSLHFTYLADSEPHQVWYEDATTTSSKLDLVARYGLGGASFWHLGGEDPAVWAVVQQKLARAEGVVPGNAGVVPLSPGCTPVVGGTAISGAALAAQVTPVSAVVSVWVFDTALRVFQSAYFRAPGVPADVATLSPQASVFVCLAVPGTYAPGPTPVAI
jgi:GH18 family chitinase